MRLYDLEGNSIKAVSSKPPNFRNGDWDSIYANVDDTQMEFYFSNQANRSNFYFFLQDKCYRLPMFDERMGQLMDKKIELFTTNQNDKTRGEGYDSI